jgi:hypothetical protein
MPKRHTAIHEAGHFVCGFRYRLDADSVSIVADYDAGSAGRVAQEDSHWDREQGVVQVQALCAGYAALVAAGFPAAVAELGCDNDFERAEDICAFWDLGPLAERKAEAVVFMSTPENRRAVDVLARELCRRDSIDGDYANVLVDYADGECTAEEVQQYRAFRSYAEE